MVSAINGPPDEKEPSANESRADIVPIQSISENPISKYEYVRKITTKQIDVASAEPPRAKMENTGKVTAFILRLIPRLSLPWRIEQSNVRFVSPEINAVKNGQIEA